MQVVQSASMQDDALIEQKTIAGLVLAQAEKKALLDADKKVVHELQATQAEMTALLESEKSKNRDIETTVAEREALLKTERCLFHKFHRNRYQLKVDYLGRLA